VQSDTVRFMRARFAILAASAALATLAMLVPGEESRAEPAKKPDAGNGPSIDLDKYDPDNKTHISRFMEAVVDGNGKATSRDFPGATELYRKAIQLAPSNPLGHYLLAEVQLLQGNVSEAEASLNQADSVGEKAPAIKLKVLFVLAGIKEQQKKWDDARAAWKRYTDYAGNHDAGAVAFPASAAARIQAMDDMLKQDHAYDIVRERIAVEKDGGQWTPKDGGK